MGRSKPPRFIPVATSFSRLEQSAEEGNVEELFPAKEDDLSEMWLEQTILSMLSCLPSDRDKVILLIQILRGYGFRFEHQSIAKLFGIKVRWYLRLLQRIRRKLAPFRDG